MSVARGALRTCPRCTSADIRRSRREGFTDAVFAALSLFPYRCRACNRRFRLRSRTGRTRAQQPRLRQNARAENTRRRRALQQREMVLYGLALAAFAVVVLLVSAERS